MKIKKIISLIFLGISSISLTLSSCGENSTSVSDNSNDPSSDIVSNNGSNEIIESSSEDIYIPSDFELDDMYGYYIKAPKDRPLKIAQFADLHFGIVGNAYHNDKPERTKEYMDYIVETTKPDFIVCSGDNVLTTGVNKLNDFIKMMDEYKTPWTFIYGNHDAESTASGYCKADLSEALYDSRSPYLIYYPGYTDDTSENRYGNFSISVLNHNGTKLIGAMILLDAGTYVSSLSTYQTITTGQIEWYENEIDRLQRLYQAQDDNLHDVIPSVIFSHIQLPEFQMAYNLAKTNNGAKFIINQEIESSSVDGGSNINNGFYDVLVEKKSTKAYLVGHAHTYKFQVEMDGITMGFAPQTGFSKTFEDNDLPRNTYVYNFNEDFTFTTTNCVENADSIGLAFSGTYDGVATYDETTKLYTFEADFEIWNRLSFSFNGIRLTTDTMTVTGLFKAGAATWNEYLYSTNGKSFIYSGKDKRTYVFTYNADTNTLNISLK